MGKLLWLIGIICAVWVIYDVWTKNQRLSETNKILWTIFALIFNIVAAIIYYVVHKSNTER
ncbi:PLDc N-terminal domain-containing protein [Fulvivirga sedimenti]|uniref:PLDc N-terminal domain-containing protein n=1 Tax=Fulvivirga sedimenti TaxID=2879465 RepID=A0A9X1HNJ9_9BACT|nr:PLDc N-terminal domain-containing protein [Fulvivirga sedimenti]MCA6074290.1 PLDc N-terminal domain-containing protein [Fulvivirga sedimenti]